MNIIILGAAGFIGTNLAIRLVEHSKDKITLVDEKEEYFSHFPKGIIQQTNVIIQPFSYDIDFDRLLNGQDIVYHLVSTSNPSTANNNVSNEMENNVVFSARLLEACVRNKIARVVFISSGGTVYGKNVSCPIAEDSTTDPICSYGIQKLAIEKLLYLFYYVNHLDYRIIRLANPYGPYQRPNGRLGAVTTFTYKALHNENIDVYGDGSVIRDYIYIDDAIDAIIAISRKESSYKLYNVGSGHGTSINELIEQIGKALQKELNVVYHEGRLADVPINYLDVHRYENEFGKTEKTRMIDGIMSTACFLSQQNKE